MRRGLLLGLVCQALILSGCSDTASRTETVSAVDVQLGRGAIEGSVTDDEGLPIEDALVNIFSKDDATRAPVILTTNSTGGFAARGLQEGPYTVFATKEGYEDPQPKTVSVVDGVTASATFELVVLEIAEPYHESVLYRATFTVEICVFSPAGNQCPAAFDPSNLTILIEISDTERVPLGGFVVEVDWVPNLSVCSKGFQTHLFSPEQKGLDTTFPTANEGYWTEDNPYHWDNVPEATSSPTRMVVPRQGDDPAAMHSSGRTALNDGEPIQIDGTWPLQTWAYNQGVLGAPVDVGCTAEQPIEIWTSTFWLQGPPGAFTALPG